VSLGRLYLLPAWLSEDTPPEHVVPALVLERIRALDAFVVENAKSARRFIASCGHPKPLRDIAMAELNEHTPAADVPGLLEVALGGRDLGLLSEAGAPAVADPGALLVAAAHASGVKVVPMVGPSSVLLALMASGLEGQRFRFAGYLPAESAARRAALVELERQSARYRETQIFIETPYRNDAMLADILQACRPATRLAVAADLTAPTEWIRSQPVEAWRADTPAIGKRPAIFLLLA
jgi:16S rRNA (cytidine1402-2'-O)-methyltransferase